MKYIHILSLVLLMSLQVIGLKAAVYSVETGQFEKLKVNGNISVVYKNLPDSTGFAWFEGSEPDLFSFSNKNDGTLKVEPGEEKWGSSDLPVIHVYSDFLTSVESYSDKEIIINDIAPCATFNVNQIGNGYISVENIKSNNVTAAITTGNGSITLSGMCVNANFRMVGTGLISADRLRADNIKCRILGTGSIGCWPIDNLNVTGLGTTKIYYKGSPNIKKTGGGKLFQLPEGQLPSEGVEVKSLEPTNLEESGAIEIEEEEEIPETEETISEEDDDDYQTVVTEDD